MESIDFDSYGIGIDTVRATLLYHLPYEMEIYDQYSSFHRLTSAMWRLYRKVEPMSEVKRSLLDNELYSYLSLKDLFDDYNIISLKGSIDPSQTPMRFYLYFKKLLGHDPVNHHVLAQNIEIPVDVAFKVYLPFDMHPPALVLEKSLQTVATSSEINLDKKVNYVRKLREITFEAKSFFIELIQTYFNYDIDLSGNWFLARIDLMSDADDLTVDDVDSCLVNEISKYEPSEYIKKGPAIENNSINYIPPSCRVVKKRCIPFYKKSGDISFDGMDAFFKEEKRYWLPFQHFYNKTTEKRTQRFYDFGVGILRYEQMYMLDFLKKVLPDVRTEFSQTGTVESFFDKRRDLFKRYSLESRIKEAISKNGSDDFLLRIFHGDKLKVDVFNFLRYNKFSKKSFIMDSHLGKKYGWFQIKKALDYMKKLGYVSLYSRRYYTLTDYALNNLLPNF